MKLFEKYPLKIRRGGDLGCVLRFDVLAIIVAREFDAAQVSESVHPSRDGQRFRFHEKNPLPPGIEPQVRHPGIRAAARQVHHEMMLAAIPVVNLEVRFRCEVFLAIDRAAPFQISDLRGVRRKNRIRILIALRGYLLRVRAVCVSRPHRAFLRVRPGDISHAPSVRAHGGRVFEMIRTSQATGIGVARFDIEMTERVVNYLIARASGPSHQARIVAVGRDFLSEANGGGDFLRDARGERNRRRFFCLDIDADEFSLRGYDDALSVRHPAITGIGSEYGPRFLLIASEIIVYGPFSTRFDFAQVERGFQTVAPDEGEILTVGRNLRSNRAARPARENRAASVGRVVTLDPVNAVVDVLVVIEGGAVDEVDESPAGIDGRLAAVCRPVGLFS